MSFDQGVVNYIIENDGMCLDGEEAWFVDRIENVLYKWNLKSEICNFITTIPVQKKKGYRNNSVCLKCEDDIFLFPDIGTCILIYNIKTNCFTNISINNPSGARIGAFGCWREKEDIWVTALGLKEIWRISITEKKIIAIYKIFENMEIECGNAIEQVDDKLYIGAANTGILCEFCISTEKIRYYDIKEMKDGINTICYDGGQFWLSGKTNKITGWNRETGDLREIVIPAEFIEKSDGRNTGQIEKRLFHQSLYDGQRVWFCPWKLKKSQQICKNILYIECGSYEVNSLELDWREKTPEGIFAAYIQPGNSMGLSSIGDNSGYFAELDLKMLTICEKHMYRTYEDMKKTIHDKLLERKKVEEHYPMELEAFIEICEEKQQESCARADNTGLRIYENISAD